MFDNRQTPIYMKQYSGLLLLTVILFSFNSQAQEKAPLYKTSIPRNAADSDRIIQQRLVALALQGPRYRVTEYQNKINEYELKRTKAVLLNQIAITSNINGQTFTKQNSPTAPAVVYPKLTAGITIPLGTVFSHTETKAAREQVKMGKDNQELLSRTIKREILSYYVQYKAASDQITNMTVLVEDQSSDSSQIRQRVENGRITLEEYGKVSQLNSASKTELILARQQRDLIKLQIEEMIGIPLEDVLSWKNKAGIE